MSWYDLRERWDELSEHARRNWARLTDRDVRVIAGNRERLVGVLQQRYGAHRRTIEREVRAFTKAFEAATALPLDSATDLRATQATE